MGDIVAPVTPWPRWAPTALLGIGGIAAFAIVATSEAGRLPFPLPQCPFHAMTGLWCPGCGSTRVVRSLLHGDIVHAFAMNPLLVLALPVVALMALSAAGWNPPQLAGFRRTFGSPRLWLWLLGGYWVLRNLPWPPFHWLAPGGLGW